MEEADVAPHVSVGAAVKCNQCSGARDLNWQIHWEPGPPSHTSAGGSSASSSSTGPQFHPHGGRWICFECDWKEDFKSGRSYSEGDFQYTSVRNLRNVVANEITRNWTTPNGELWDSRETLRATFSGCIWNAASCSPDEIWGDTLLRIFPQGDDSYGGMLLSDAIPHLKKWFRNKQYHEPIIGKHNKLCWK